MDRKYTVTIYVAAPGTPLAQTPGSTEKKTSTAGHVYFQTSDGNSDQSFGFSPKKEGSVRGPGHVTYGDVDHYQSPYYARTIEISKEQYEKLNSYGNAPAEHKFDMHYNGASNSCIDFTWSALNHAGLHRRNVFGHESREYEGSLKPLDNKRDIEGIAPPFPNSPLNRETHNKMPSRTLLQWYLSENGEPLPDASSKAVAAALPDLGEKDKAMLDQLRSKVGDLDAANGRSFDATSERISASLLVLAKDNGLSRVDQVLLSEKTTDAAAAQNIFIVQGERSDPAQVRASMPTALAAQTPVEQSIERAGAIDQAQQRASTQDVSQQDRSLAEQHDNPSRRMG